MTTTRTRKTRNKTRARLTPLAKRIYDLQLEARSLEVKLGNLIPKIVQAEQYAMAFERQVIQHLNAELEKAERDEAVAS